MDTQLLLQALTLFLVALLQALTILLLRWAEQAKRQSEVNTRHLEEIKPDVKVIMELINGGSQTRPARELLEHPSRRP